MKREWSQIPKGISMMQLMHLTATVGPFSMLTFAVKDLTKLVPPRRKTKSFINVTEPSPPVTTDQKVPETRARALPLGLFVFQRPLSLDVPTTAIVYCIKVDWNSSFGEWLLPFLPYGSHSLYQLKTREKKKRREN